MSTMPMRPPWPAIPWRAFLIAPLAAPAAYCALLTIEALIERPEAISISSWLQLAALAFALGAPGAYFLALTVGIYVFVSLARMRALRLPLVVLASAGIGAAVALGLEPSLRGELFSIPLGPWRGAICGACAGLTWWRLGPGAGRPGGAS